MQSGLLSLIAASAAGDWTIVEWSATDIGPVVSTVVPGAPDSVLVLTSVRRSSVRPRQDTADWRVVLSHGTPTGTQRETIEGLSPTRFNDALFRQLLLADDRLLLVLAREDEWSVLGIDEFTATVLLEVEDPDDLMVGVYALEQTVVVLSRKAVRIARVSDLSRWQTVTLGSFDLLDAVRGGGDCPLEAVMRGSAGYGVYCIDPTRDAPELLFSLGAYGLDEPLPPALIGSTPSHIVLVAHLDREWLGVNCSRARIACRTTTLPDAGMPGLKLVLPEMAVLPGAASAISVRVGTGQEPTVVLAHDLGSGRSEAIATLAAPQRTSLFRPRSWVRSAAILPSDDGVTVLVTEQVSGLLPHIPDNAIEPTRHTLANSLSIERRQFSADYVRKSLAPD